MPKKIRIMGDDPIWKRAVDEELAQLRRDLDAALRRISYLENRNK